MRVLSFVVPHGACDVFFRYSCVRFCVQAVAEAAEPSRNVIGLEESRLTVYKETPSNSFTEA